MPVNPQLKDMKCIGCGKKLAEYRLEEGIIEVKCKCGTINTIRKTKPETIKNSSRN